MTTTTSTTTTDFEAIKTKQQATWSSGDYAVIGTTLQIVGESLSEAVDIAAGERVLDVAAGNGNATPRGRAPRSRCHGIRLRAGAVGRARARAAADGLRINVREADAEALPFDDEKLIIMLENDSFVDVRPSA